jgi:aromatic-L-amino-acid decarboxylase
MTAAHMTPEEFRQAGYRMIDWIADYWDRVGELPVLAQVKPGAVRSMLPETAPDHGESWDDIFADIDRVVLPGITHWQSPSFFAYFPANASGPAVLGDLLSSGLGVQGMLWATSPACTEIETLVLDWLQAAMGLPAAFHSSSTGGGVLQDSASSSTLVALLAARHRASGGADVRAPVADLVVYTSTQAHSAIDKAVRIAGLGAESLRAIEVDDAFAMRPELLVEAIEADLAAGRKPMFVCATIGTTSSTGIDPIRRIGEICDRYGLWLHVDAAFAGSAALLPECAGLFDGLERADSYVFNPHKWMLTNFDCSAFWVRDRANLVSALSVLPEFLRNRATESGAVIDYRDWQIPLGRRFRALKLWFVLRHYGLEGIRAQLRAHIGLARDFVDRVEGHPAFVLTAPAPLSLVCFRHVDGDAATQAVLDRVNGSGEAYLTHTRLDGHLTLRLAIGGTHTSAADVDRVWDLITAR